jgi:hypothetical protein
MVNGAMTSGVLITWTAGLQNVSAVSAVCRVAAESFCCMACRDQLLLDQPDWDYQGFMSAHLSDYLVMSQQFMAEYFAEDGQEQQ